MNRTDRIHRITAGLLCFIMLLTMALTVMPMTAFAANSKEISIELTPGGTPVQSFGDGWTYDDKTRILVVQNGYSLNKLWKIDEKGRESVATSGIVINNYGTIAMGYGYCSKVNNKSGGLLQFHESDTIYNMFAIVENEQGGIIRGGFFNGNGSVTNYGTIEGGIFESSVENRGTIKGGVFFGKVENYGSIDGGYFLNDITNKNDGIVGASAKQTSAYNLHVESKCGSVQITHTNESVRKSRGISSLSVGTSQGIAGAVYQVINTTDLVGLYLLGEDDEIPQAPYSITSDFRAGFLNAYYEFTMPDENTTVFAVFKGYGGELTVSGALDESFNFVLGGSGEKYLLGLQTPPTGLQTYEWSVKGTLPAGLSLIDSTTSNPYIGGTPTEVTDEPVALTVCVSATAANGDVYYGEADILVSVYEPINPFEEAVTLLEDADCTIPMEVANTEENVSEWLNDTWLPGIDGLSVALGGEFAVSDLSVVIDEDFTAATAGNAANPNGTDGSVSFTVEIGGEIVLCENLICTVKATAYNHTHSFSDTYTYDDTYHWHECTDPECDAVSGKAEHSGTDDNNCTTAVFCKCGYCTMFAAVNHDFTGEYKHDDNSHWHVCKNLGCAMTDTAEKHRGGTATYTARAICSVCGQPYGTKAADTTAPTGSITVGTNTWNSFLNTITFGLFFKKKQEVKITAADTESAVMKTGYYLSDEKISDFGSVTWTEYTGQFNINPDNEYIIYVKITDNAGNSVIISSDGIVLDSIAPVLSGIVNGKTYCGAVEVTVSDKYLNSVKLNGDEIQLINGKFTVSPADGQQTVTATDRAGNSTSYAITVNSGHTWQNEECTACGSKIISAIDNTEQGNAFGIRFEPAAGVTLPEGTELVVKPYTPTAEDKNKIAEAILSGSQPNPATSIDVKKYTVYKRTDYTEGSVSMWDVISLDNTKYILMEFEKAKSTNLPDNYERRATYFRLDNGIYYDGEYSYISGTGHWYIDTYVINSKTYQFSDEPETIVINGATYIICYKIGIKTDNETNLLYTQDGKAAGSFIKDLDGEMTGFIFYDDCKPEVLKESQASSSWQFSSGDLTVNVDTIFSSDISLEAGGASLPANGNIRINTSGSGWWEEATSLDKDMEKLIAYHIDKGVLTEGEVATTTDGLVATFPIGGQSPFLILSITEAEPFEVPVHTVEAGEPGGDSPQTGDNNNVFLWIALLLISGGAVTVLGITGKRRRAANDK